MNSPEEWLELNKQLNSKTIDRIEEVRRENNINWMNLVRLAVKYAPKDEVRTLLGRIELADWEVNNLWRSLRQHL